MGCYVLAIHYFSLGIYRDHVYYQALETQPTYQPLIDSIIIKSLAIALFALVMFLLFLQCMPWV